jgi:hypothetical protein
MKSEWLCRGLKSVACSRFYHRGVLITHGWPREVEQGAPIFGIDDDRPDDLGQGQDGEDRKSH